MAISARLDELKKKFDENPRRYFAPLANEYRKKGDTTQAIALCRTHLPNQPGHISGHIVLAQALYESRELAESRQIFEAALELDPENIIALRYLGDIAREQGAPAEAQAWYRRVLEFDPRNEEISQLLADVREDADVAVADLANRPTPPTGGDSPIQTANTTVADPGLLTAATPVPPELSYSRRNDAAIEPEPSLPIEAFDPVATGSGPVDQGTKAPEIAEEPLDLYDADPTGDAWRESLFKEPEPPPAKSDQGAGIVSAAQVNPPVEPEVRSEPSFDDWFAQPSVQDAASSAEPAIEEFAPDLAAAVPAEPQPAPADVIDEFTWSFTETEQAPEPEQGDHGASVEGSAPEAPEIEFTAWSAPDAHSADAVTDGARGNDAAPAQPLPSLSDAVESTVGESVDQVAAPDESATAAWNEPVAAEGARDADIDAAFEDDANDSAEQPAAEPEADVLFWSEPAEPGVAEEPVVAGRESEDADDIPGIASLHEDVGEMDATSLDESDDDAFAAMSSSDPIIGRTPSFVAEVSEESSAAFVTETMAELYLQQGFYEEALSIYKQLLARSPNDRTLAERVRALEEGTTSTVDADAVSAPPAPGSESARSFFARFANRGPGRGEREGNGPDRRGDAMPVTTVPLAGAAMPDEALTRPDEGTLTNIFSAQQVPAGDAQAARTLASAFGAIPASTPTRSGELSLQQLFRDVPARSSGAVTLGEQGAGSTTGSSDAPPASGSDAEAPADYEQFTAWLEGLKKK